MRSLFQSFSQFLKRFFRLGQVSDRPQRSTRVPRRSSNRSPGRSPSTSDTSTELRRLIYQAAYDLPRRRIHAGQFGPRIKAQDGSFSYEKYGFSKLIHLLEAFPDLVSVEREIHGSVPAYYVKATIDIKRLLVETLEAIESEDGWIHTDSMMAAIAQTHPTFAAPTYGYTNFSSFLQSRPDLIAFKDDTAYIRLTQTKHTPRPKLATKRRSPIARTRRDRTDSQRRHDFTPRTTKRPDIIHLSRFTGFTTDELHQKVIELAALAMQERWYFGAEPPAAVPHPILKSYLRYTFIRLQYEGKVLTGRDRRYRAFNTGLRDRHLLKPIYALLAQQEAAPRSNGKWSLDFCIPSGNSAGKILVGEFDRLPETANYLAKPERIFYDISAGMPEVNWAHVVKENMERLPYDFIVKYAPSGFVPQPLNTLKGAEFHRYKQSFSDALDADSGAYRAMVNQLEAALEHTLLRIQLNYKTAVPTYYPKINSIDLMLPICLFEDDVADCAIVVRRQASGKYIGHTIFTMIMAYNNARLICQLDEHWLSRAMTLSQEDFEEEEDESLDEFLSEEGADESDTEEEAAIIDSAMLDLEDEYA